MGNVLLFSELTASNKNSICEKLFEDMDSSKTLAYMPSSGIQGSESYTAQWKNVADEYGVQFVAVDNTSSNGAEQDQLLESHTLLISGGNTFQLLHNLRKSGLDKAVVEFSHKQNVLLAGFSAGALVLTPTIKICELSGFDENLIGLEDLNGLGIVDFEVYPHYDKRLHEGTLADYRKTTLNEVREITNADYIFATL